MALLTRDATVLIRTIHDRMPVIVPEQYLHEWLSLGQLPNMIDELNFVPI
jgi:Uncharacterized conserved protein